MLLGKMISQSRAKRPWDSTYTNISEIFYETY